MKNKHTALLWAASAILALLVASCTKDNEYTDTGPNTTLMEEQLVRNLEADTAKKNRYTFWNLFDADKVVSADSASAQWHLAFRGTTIRVNSGVSGPGEVQAQVMDAVYDEVVSAPVNGYSEDTEEILAIPVGSGNGWYSYDSQNHVILPIAGKVLIIKVGDRYFKMEVISYYLDAPATPNFNIPARLYTYRYQEISSNI